MTLALLVGHGFNYALILGANRILDSGGFGLFYTAVLAITVAVAPVMAITFVLARRFADVNAQFGQAQVTAMTRRVLVLCARWGVPIAVAVGIALTLAGPWFDIDAWPLALLIALAVLVLGVAEVLRAAFQGMLLFGWSSALWITSQAAQFALAIGGLLLFTRVWTGVAGILAGGAFACAAFAPWFVPTLRGRASERSVHVPLTLRRELPMIASYSLFILLNNLDILVGYWLLPRAALDVYAASALLPKAIITATFPVAQVVLPVIVDQRLDGISSRLSVLKAVAMVVAMSVPAALVLWAVVPLAQATPFAIRGLDFSIMTMLAAGAVALSALRILVVVEVALRRYAFGLAQAGAVVLFLVLCARADIRAHGIAELYTIVSWGFLVTAIATLFLARTRFSGLIRSQQQ